MPNKTTTTKTTSSQDKLKKAVNGLDFSTTTTLPPEKIDIDVFSKAAKDAKETFKKDEDINLR